MLTIPNLLSLYRIMAAPIAVWMALAGAREAYFILIIVSFASDLVDGPIARRLGKVSSSGAMLDTIADSLTLLAGFVGIFVFERPNLLPEIPWIFVFMASYAAAAITAMVKFRVLPAYHLYLSKAASFLAGVFIVWLFLVGFSRHFFLAVVSIGVLANLESVAATLALKRFRSDIRSVFLILVHRRDETRDQGRDSH